ncbi:MAG: tetratricopeptide repeat protein, partial [Blastocatellia bacterium]
MIKLTAKVVSGCTSPAVLALPVLLLAILLTGGLPVTEGRVAEVSRAQSPSPGQPPRAAEQLPDGQLPDGQLPDGQLPDGQLEEAKTELRKGRYAAAIETFGAILRRSPDQPVAQEGLLRALLETGQYRLAETEARRFLSRPAADAGVNLLLGEILAATGRDREALPVLEKAAGAESQSVKVRALLRRGELLAYGGDEDGARKIYEALARYYEENVVEDSAELTAIAGALVHLEKFQEANDLFLEVIGRDRDHIDAHLGGG